MRGRAFHLHRSCFNGGAGTGPGKYRAVFNITLLGCMQFVLCRLRPVSARGPDNVRHFAGGAFNLIPGNIRFCFRNRPGLFRPRLVTVFVCTFRHRAGVFVIAFRF